MLRRLLPLLALLVPASAAAAGDPIMPLAQVQPGMHCQARSVVRGTAISTFNADVVDVIDGDGASGARILVRVSGAAVDATGIGEGFSGSPVYCPDAQGVLRNVGAISETIGQYGNSEVLVTPIEQILATDPDPPVGLRVAGARPIAAPIAISGLPASLAATVQRAAAKVGRTVVAAPGGSAAAARFAPQDLVPGAAVSAGYSSGDISSGAIGTVSYRDGSTIWAFGHPLDDAGRRALFLQDAYVYDVIGNPLSTAEAITYKLAAPGHDLGIVTADGDNAIAGTIGPAPPQTAMTIDTLDQDTGRGSGISLRLADETDAGLPTGFSPLSFIGPLAVSTAAMRIYDGTPAAESGRMCLQIKLVEYSKPFGFCNRYVTNTPLSTDSPPPLAELAATDASSALSVFDGVTFARLHVQSVKVAMRAQRGLADGFMTRARAARRVRRGHVARITLTVRRYRGPLVTERLKIRVPRNLPRGGQRLKLVGTGPDDASGGDVSTIIIDALGPGSNAGDPGPTTLRSVIDSVEANARYDGVHASFPDAGRHGRSLGPVFLDRKLRISGTANVVLHVR